MAPEQVDAAGNVDHRADLYSLGVVLYEMLTGSLPIGRFQPPSARAAGAKGLDPVVMKSLESDPGQRYQQAREIKSDLAAAGMQPQGAPPVAGASLAKDGIEARPPTTGRESRDLPWASIMVFGIVVMASFMSWGTVSSTEFGVDVTLSAWNSYVKDIPSWLGVVMAAAVLALATARGHGVRIPRGAMLAAAGVGAGQSGLFFLCTANDAHATAGPGSALTCICLLGSALLELRRIATAPVAGYRRTRTRGRRRSRSGR
jgi:hypothetical protein